MPTDQQCSGYQISNGECQDTFHDVISNAAQQPEATPAATRIPSIEQSMLPSVERRRRRLTLQGTTMGTSFTHDKYAKFGRFDSSTTAVSVLGLLFLIAVLHRGERLICLFNPDINWILKLSPIFEKYYDVPIPANNLHSITYTGKPVCTNLTGYIQKYLIYIYCLATN